MRLRLALGLALVALTAVHAAAQQATHVWTWVTPDGEEFGVLFPEVNYRIRRELFFGNDRFLHPVSYEVTRRGVHFMVLSFPKGGPNAPQSFQDFTDGIRRALAANTGRARASFVPRRAVKLEGHDGREFAVRVGNLTGTARAYEAAGHYYLVMGVGHPSGAAAVGRFQDSFSFNLDGPSRVPAGEVAEVLTKPLPTPEPLWPLANGRGLVIGARDASAFPSQEYKPPRGPVMGGILTGKALRKVSPPYPAIAKAARAQGAVVVQILVDEEGYVIAAAAVSGHPLLQQAAALAVRQWRFTPTTLSGQPVKVSGTVTVNFKLDGGPPAKSPEA